MNFENERNSIEAFEFLRISNSLEFSNPLSKHTLRSYTFLSQKKKIIYYYLLGMKFMLYYRSCRHKIAIYGGVE